MQCRPEQMDSCFLVLSVGLQPVLIEMGLMIFGFVLFPNVCVWFINGQLQS